jgi:Uri superfamily endonuclease
MGPAPVLAVQAGTSLVAAALASVGQAMAKRHGRIFVMVLFDSIGISLLATMSFLASHNVDLIGAIIPIYIVRCGLMNATGGLQQSIFGDVVRPSQRAKWESVKVLTTVGWCGSAALGGWINDTSKVYWHTFYITVGLQFLAVLCLLAIWRSVPDERVAARIDNDDEDDNVKGFGTIDNDHKAHGGHVQEQSQGERNAHFWKKNRPGPGETSPLLSSYT